MKTLARQIIKSFLMSICTIFAASLFAQEGSNSGAARKAIPIVNYTDEHWLGQYVADNASDAIYHFFLSNPKYAIYATAFGFEGQTKYCAASVGLTEATNDVKRSPRVPSTFYSSASEVEDAFEGEFGCYGKALKRAVSEIFVQDVSSLEKDIAAAKDDNKKIIIEKKDADLINSYSVGVSSVGTQYLRKIHPEWFPVVIDKRYYSVIYEFLVMETEKGDTVCVAKYGITAKFPSERNPRHPVASRVVGRFVVKSEMNDGKLDSLCFNPLYESIIPKITPDSGIFEVFVNNWAAVAEPGLPAPTAKNIMGTYKTWVNERQRKAIQAEQRIQKAATRNRTNMSCSNECFNGSCVRTFSDGKKEHWKAPRTFNPLTNNWEWDILTNACGN